MKLYLFLSCLLPFLLPTVANPLPTADNSDQLGFTELDPPPFSGHFESQLPTIEEQSPRLQVDTNSNLNPSLFSVTSGNPVSQIEHFSQTSIAEGPDIRSDGNVCDDESESIHGSKNFNKYRIRRDRAMCAVKEEDIDWDTLWATFSKARELTGGGEPACTDPHYSMHVCCRGPQSRYVHNPNLIREVKNCAPCKLSSTLLVPCRYSGIVNISMLIVLMLCALPYFNLCCQTFEVSLIISSPVGVLWRYA